MIYFKNPFQRTKIKSKLILIFAIVISYTLIVLIFFGYGSYRDLMIKKSLSYSKKNSEVLSMLLQEKVNNLNNFTRTVLYDDRIYSFNRSIILSDQDPYFQYKFSSDVGIYLRSILYSKDEFLSVGFMFTQRKEPFVVSRIYTMNSDVLADMNKLYSAAKTGRGKPVWYIDKTNGANDIYVVKMVYDINTLKEIGIYIFRLNPSSIFDVLRNVSENMQQNIYIFDNFNHLLFSYKYFEPSYKNFQNMLLRLQNSDSFKAVKTNNDTVYVNSNDVTPENFKMAICVSSKTMTREVNSLSKFLFLLFLMTIPILIILVNYFHIDIIKPLNLLVNKMKKIENGEIGTTIELKRRDEIGYVFKTFNKMSQEIKVLIDSVYREQIALKDEEIKALQAQINPHFLYNTLEAINWKARIHGVGEISDMVSALSYIMEANMNRTNEKFISIKKEIEYIDNYRFIIEKRFNEKLRFSIEVKEDLYKYNIPKLIILPVIENSVYHGLEMKKGDGIVELSIYLEDKNLLIRVSDNGLGIDKDTLKRIKNYLDIDINKIDDNERKSITNIGLINVHKRIRLLYGNEYGIEIQSIPNEGTTVFIKLPCILPEIDG